MTEGTSAEPGATRRVLLAVHTGRARHRRAGAHLGGATHRGRHRRPSAGRRGRRPWRSPAPRSCLPTRRPRCDAEIVMVFGGDGTFLRAAELARYTDAA